MPQRRGPDEARPVLLVSHSQLQEEIGRHVQRGRELLEPSSPSWDDLVELNRNFDTWDDYSEQLLRSRFSTGQIADEYRRPARGLGSSVNPARAEAALRRSFDGQLRKLESIGGTLELYESASEEAKIMGSAGNSRLGTKVFIVHGHDGSTKLEVAEFIQRITGERPVILHEQPSYGSSTVIEKFEANAAEAGFAVILLTADDIGGVNGAAEQRPRARQNVVLEFGYFMGKLGRGRVVALYEKDVELPSDVAGVLYMPLSENWKVDLAKELHAAEIDIDLGKLL
jgi:predicted nucleotide-binding protein